MMSKQRLVLTSILILTLTAGLLVLNPSMITNASAEICDNWDEKWQAEDQPAKISPVTNEEPEPASSVELNCANGADDDGDGDIDCEDTDCRIHPECDEHF